MKIEADAGYIVKIGEPVCIAEVKATSTSVSIPCDPIADGDYLISLEVNGTVTARRESFSFASGSATVGDYTVAYASNAVTVSTTEENDIVNIMIEPLKVFATDEFKAAVAKVAPAAAASGGGGTGGGVLVVHEIQHQGETIVSGTLPNITGYQYSSSSHGEGRIDFTVVGIGETIQLDTIVVTIGTKTYSGNDLAVQDTDTLRVKLKGEQTHPESAITGLTITVVESYTALDHTWQEISDAEFAVFNNNGGIYTISYIWGETESYIAVFYLCHGDEQEGVGIEEIVFSTSSASGYPARNE